MKYHKGDRFSVEIERLGISGEGVARHEQYTLFVDLALPGEKVEVELYDVRKTFARARIIHTQRFSQNRVEPPCPLFGHCGGCQIMHLAYDQQLDMKRQKVIDAFERIGKLDSSLVTPCTASPLPLHYRNKIQLPVNREKRLGLFARQTHDIVPIEKCYIHTPLGEEVFQVVQNAIQKSPIRAEDLSYVLIKTALQTNEVLVTFITPREQIDFLSDIAREIFLAKDEIKGVVQNINRSDKNTILGQECKTLEGSPSITDKICGLQFKVSLASFFQVNPLQAEALYQRALFYADLKGDETVLDAYCGVGTLSLIFAQKAKKVIGVECVKAAIEDAEQNAKINGIQNAHFTAAEAEQFIQTVEPIDIAIVNPPRKGCAPEFIHTLIELNPKKIIYISCDPATLARDLKLLTEQQYTIEIAEPFDMFPQTAHVETLVSLKTVKI